MKKLIDNFANLIKVKTIITMAVMAVFIIMSLRGDIRSDNVMLIVGTVTAFYFGTISEKAGGSGR